MGPQYYSPPTTKVIPPTTKVIWRWDLSITSHQQLRSSHQQIRSYGDGTSVLHPHQQLRSSHQQLRSYGDGTSVLSLIQRTGGVGDLTWDPCFTSDLSSTPRPLLTLIMCMLTSYKVSRPRNVGHNVIQSTLSYEVST